MIRLSRTTWLSIAQVAVFAIMLATFFVIAPWPSAMTREAARTMTDLPIPESWDVVIIGGGEVHRWRWGTLSQNPWWFIAGVVLIFAGEVFVVWSIFSVEMSRWRSKTMGDDR